MTIQQATRYVYDFDEGAREMRVLLGGKGANIAEMTRVLGPDLVPAGFTITTDACVAFMREGGVEPPGLAEQVAEGIARLEERAGRRLGDPEDPLLVSVRSGARDSMPGMLESGVKSSNSRRCLPLNWAFTNDPVRIRPGTTVTTPTPLPASSARRPSEKPTAPNFAAL